MAVVKDEADQGDDGEDDEDEVLETRGRWQKIAEQVRHVLHFKRNAFENDSTT